MLTCLCDAFYGEVGIATVRVLEACGIAVEFEEEQTCCGQPPFNAGDWNSARPIAERCVALFKRTGIPVVVPSGSCAAMLREGYELLLGESFPAYELSEFLVDVIDAPSRLHFAKVPNRRVTYHSACHGRSLKLNNKPLKLLASVPNLEVILPEHGEQCCGFGGAFSITHSHLSAQIGKEKLRNLISTDADMIVSGDMGCLIHLSGLMQREGIEIAVSHWVQVLAEALA